MEKMKNLARRIVRESAVLLKNGGQVLPLKENACAAVFGRAQLDTFVSGNGSGAAHRAGCKGILPFELMVREGPLSCIMTSFNKINGTFSAGSRELCTGILREEWGFEGIVVTDWGDMDVVVDGADAIHAGNDIVMPGGPPVIRQILQGYAEGRVTREELERSVRRLLRTCARTRGGKTA